MRYSVNHLTRFNYDSPISESIMEVRMQPRSDGQQRCLRFALTTAPHAHVMSHQDHDGNTVHHFDIPARHSRLTLTAQALVECQSGQPIPNQIGPRAWSDLHSLAASGEFWEFLSPSAFVLPTPLLGALAREIGLEPGDDPLVMLRRLTEEIYARFEYSPQSTQVDSPIDDALRERRGVCQDFAHIFIALTRPLGIPARYVSGYLFHHTGSSDRSTDGASHAWVEAFVPPIGWIGFDPTNNLIAEQRHIRVAIGRDYADVPPTRGIYKGISSVRSELAVSVRVGSVEPLPGDVTPFVPWVSHEAPAPSLDDDAAQQQQ